MTVGQVVVNSRVVTEEADRLARMGFEGDSVRFVEQLLLRAFTAGWRPVEPPVPTRGPGASRQAIDAAKAAAADAVRSAKDSRNQRSE